MFDPGGISKSDEFMAKTLAVDISQIIKTRRHQIVGVTDGDSATVCAVILAALAHVAAGAANNLTPNPANLRALMTQYALTCQRFAQEMADSQDTEPASEEGNDV